MSRVAVVTDSVATIPQSLTEKYGIHVVPQVLVWGDETFRDGVDISPDAFYHRLQNDKVMPTTSQAPPKAFAEIYRKLLDEDYHILTIVVSTKLSGTYISAMQAKEALGDAPVEVVDSYSAAMAMGFQVVRAAEAAQQGASLAECKAIAEQARQHTGVLFAVDTLEFLHRGGRIGGGARLLGTALNLKPILELRDGRVEPVDRVRTRRKSLTRLVELFCERVRGQEPLRLATLNASAPADAELLLEEVKQQNIKIDQSITSDVSPVIGTHVGPGTVGLAWMVGM